jgi:hypothetical protein
VKILKSRACTRTRRRDAARDRRPRSRRYPHGRRADPGDGCIKCRETASARSVGRRGSRRRGERGPKRADGAACSRSIAVVSKPCVSCWEPASIRPRGVGTVDGACSWGNLQPTAAVKAPSAPVGCRTSSIPEQGGGRRFNARPSLTAMVASPSELWCRPVITESRRSVFVTERCLQRPESVRVPAACRFRLRARG